jgi:3-deoxy-D-manno-octulosonate 8-phosphate phosphatase (KDO 8-P phosphatase)
VTADARVLRLYAPTLAQRCRAIEWLLLDVDGVLTEGSIIYGTGAVELKHFHVRDGAGLKLWRQCGKRAAIVSGRTSAVVEVRAAELGLAPVLQGRWHKGPALERLLAEEGLRPEQVAYLGDDLPDLAILGRCGLAAAVADATPALFRVAHYVTRAPGGRGAVRELIELILRCQGRWQRVLDDLAGETAAAAGSFHGDGSNGFAQGQGEMT